MLFARNALDKSYAFCRRLSRRSGSSFYQGIKILPRQKRRAMEALYAFMRHTDDIVDAQPSQADSLDATIDGRRNHLHHWRTALEKSLSEEDLLFADPDRTSMRLITEDDSISEFLLPALVDTVKTFHIPVEYLFAVFDGVEMDLDRHRYETFDELKLYCQRVASAVGLACIHIWGFNGQGTAEGDAAFESAWQAGIALQLTNILRDLKSDAAADRVYLPLEDFRSSGYSIEELKNGVVNDSFHRLVRLEIDRAKQFYREGAKLMTFLNRDGRPIFAAMMAAYVMLLKKIRRRPGDVFSRQIKLTKLDWLWCSAWMIRLMNRLDNFSEIIYTTLNDG
ncbi:MAG: phytoene/squalene synthase family protein [Thermoguttaceae bacterium]